MAKREYSEEAYRLITKKCLIAADVDKTVLAQGEDDERKQFLKLLAPKLVDAASLGANLAFITGNSMKELSSRFLKWLIDDMCHMGQLIYLDRFHFFCNSGGVYAHFPSDDKKLSKFLRSSHQRSLSPAVLEELTIAASSGCEPAAIHPRFIDDSYLNRSRIKESELRIIKETLEDASNIYISEFCKNRKKYEKSYNIDQLAKDGKVEKPIVDLRYIEHGTVSENKKSSVQVTLKPILSFRHAKIPKKTFGKDLRTKIIKHIQKKLEQRGLGHYIARPGGRSSIDVSLEKLDKAYALEFLLDYLNLQGQRCHGEKLGSNAIYFGDEVMVGGGNDYAVTRIPGLLVFAVNSERNFIPFLHHVIAPSTILDGPEATAKVLGNFNESSRIELKKFLKKKEQNSKEKNKVKTAIQAFRENFLLPRIKEKIINLNLDSLDDIQTIHAFITLLSRSDPTSRQWLEILINELDAIMAHVSIDSSPMLGLGTSHPDN